LKIDPIDLDGGQTNMNQPTNAAAAGKLKDTADHTYSTKQVARIAGCTLRQLQWWSDRGLFSVAIGGRNGITGVSRQWEKSDILAAMIIRELNDKGHLIGFVLPRRRELFRRPSNFLLDRRLRGLPRQRDSLAPPLSLGGFPRSGLSDYGKSGPRLPPGGRRRAPQATGGTSMSSPQTARPGPTESDTRRQVERRNRLETKAKDLFRVFDRYADVYNVPWEHLNPQAAAAFHALVRYFEDEDPLCDCGRVLRCVRCDVESMR
jgi:DNA-binding transcriptional MerR regulator